MENKDLTNDELEAQGLVECCAHCGSIHITIEGNGEKYCNSCYILGYTEIISEEEYEERNKINC
jgi:hypothetical protein